MSTIGQVRASNPVVADYDDELIGARGTLDIGVLAGEIAKIGNVRLTGDVQLLNDWNAGSHKIIASVFHAGVADGAAPLIVASKTMVDNLNVEFLGGKTAGDFIAAGTLNSDDVTEGAVNLYMTVLERSKLSGVEDNATADQTNSEIEAAYNAQVGVVSKTDAEAGVSTTVERWTAERVGEAIAALAGGGASPAADWKIEAGATYTLAEGDNGKYIGFTNGSTIAITLPDTLSEDFQVSIFWLGVGEPTVTPGGTDTVNGASAGVAPTERYKGLFLSQFAATEWVATY